MNDHTQNLTDHEAGFTLLELLVSITILSATMLLLGMGLQILSKGSDVYTRKVAHLEMHSRAFDVFKRDGRNLHRIVTKTKNDRPIFLFKGNALEAEFAVLEPPFPRQASLYFVRYRIDRNANSFALFRERTKYKKNVASFPGATPANIVELISGSLGISLSYGVAGPKQTLWYADWPFQDRMPDLMRLRVEHEIRTGIAATYMVARLRADAELSCLGQSEQLCSPTNDGILKVTKKKGPAPTKREAEP